ncbi:hypothetical protein GGI10_000792 [Coemansia sp. RSA 2530]|nr:hypothetical protein GGI10_000792 [Coemansia sp. RSA 2530]
MEAEPNANAGRGSLAKIEREVVDPNRMSPRSHRRHLSRLSSAKLRERQRQLISSAEKDIAQLEARIESLQQSIDIHRMALQDDCLTDCESGHTEKTAGSLKDIVGLARDGIARTAELLCDMQSPTPIRSSGFQNGHTSAEKKFCDLTTVLAGNINQLTYCIKHIEALKNDICRQVRGIEKRLSLSRSDSTLPDAHASSSPNMQEEENTLHAYRSTGTSSARRCGGGGGGGSGGGGGVPISFLVNDG